MLIGQASINVCSLELQHFVNVNDDDLSHMQADFSTEAVSEL